MISKKPTVLIIDDDRLILDSTQLIIGNAYHIRTAECIDSAVAIIKKNTINVILLDVKMPGNTGTRHLEELKRVAEDIPVIMFSGVSDISQVIDCIKAGAFSYVVKGTDLSELTQAIDSAVLSSPFNTDHCDVHIEALSENTSCVIGQNQEVKAIFQHAKEIAPARDISILITGETGVGKEVLAQYIHTHSQSPQGPLITLNCGAIPEALIESELFGHEAGAFTDARHRRIGKFEQANGGTIFLDEISSMPLHLQVKLLRVVQEKKIDRIGSSKSENVNVRIIAATNTNLEHDIQAGRFREDLYYRIRGLELTLPPLRDRQEDFELFFNYFITQHTSKYKLPPKKISKPLIGLLKMAPWKGNIRELSQFVEVLIFLLKNDTEISIENFPKQCLTRLLIDYPTLKKQPLPTQQKLMSRIIDAFQGNITATAQFLNIDRTTIYRLMETVKGKMSEPLIEAD